MRRTAADPLDGASRVWTSDSGFTGSREWSQSAAKLSRDGEVWIVTAGLPDSATAWFVNVQSDGLTASSDYREVRSGAMKGFRSPFRRPGQARARYSSIASWSISRPSPGRSGSFT